MEWDANNALEPSLKPRDACDRQGIILRDPS